MWKFLVTPGWDTPTVPAFDPASLKRELRQYDEADCLARRQGRCPGLEFCHDCQWSEGGALADAK